MEDTKKKFSFLDAMKKNIEVVIPTLILIIFFLLFITISKGQFVQWTNFKQILDSTLPYIVAALGGVFVTTIGGTDITQGSLVGFVFAVIYKTGLVMSGGSVVVGVLAGLACGVLLGVLNAYCKVPSFMVSLGLLVFLRALAVMIGGTEYVTVPSYLSIFGNYAFAIPVIIVLIIVVWFVFHKTPYGYYARAIGENENAVKFTGARVNLYKVIAFAMSGFFTALAALFYFGTKEPGTAQITINTAGLGFEMSILIAMFVGGVPVQGGYGAKIPMIILGAFTISVMENGLVTVIGLETYWVQLIKGILLIVILFVTGLLKTSFAKASIKKKAALK